MTTHPGEETDPTHKLLGDWPFARAYLEESLDEELIEGHAFTRLSRALNIGRVVAFVGSGVSLAYGRISWFDLVDELQERTRAAAKPFLENSSEIKQLSETIEKLHGRDGNFGPDRLPIVFQACERLSQAVELEQGCSPATDGRHGLFRLAAKRRTRDSAGHTELMLRRAHKAIKAGGLWSDDDTADLENLIDDHFGRDLADPKDPRLTRADIPTLSPWIDRAFSHGLLTKLLELTGQPRKSVRPRPDAEPLPVEDRYRVLACFPLTPRSRARDALDLLGTALESALDALKARSSLPGQPISRSITFPEWRDPLVTLGEHLGVRRFLTTNYDVDIESMLRQRGFLPQEPPDEPADRLEASRDPEPYRNSFDATGGSAREFVFSHSQSETLVDFAMSPRGARYQLAHLHGRAGPDESFVVTEQDYQRQYLRDEETRDLTDQAIRLSFAANPILFVGYGMGEDDVLRPLRHFLSQIHKNDDRLAIALLPKWEETSAREEKVALLERYGVYTIHYDAFAYDGEVRINWLEQVSKRQKIMLTEIKRLLGLDEKAKPQDLGEDELKTAFRLVDPHDPDSAAQAHDPLYAPNRALRLLRPQIELLNKCHRILRELQSENQRLTLEAACPYLAMFLVAVPEIMTNVVTALFCAKLFEIRRRWSHWQGGWQQLPTAYRPFENEEGRAQ